MEPEEICKQIGPALPKPRPNRSNFCGTPEARDDLQREERSGDWSSGRCWTHPDDWAEFWPRERIARPIPKTRNERRIAKRGSRPATRDFGRHNLAEIDSLLVVFILVSTGEQTCRRSPD